jgi:lactate racemase
MHSFILPYGASNLSFTLPDEVHATLILPSFFPACPDPELKVKSALSQPIDFDWPEVEKIKSIAIAINDKTRPVPHEILLPVLLEHLKEIGFDPCIIHIWIATGTHRPMPSDEFERVIPRTLIGQYSISSHDIDCKDELIFLGNTSYQTPVWVNRDFYTADLKIVVGNIEPHHFAGFSGGMKTAAIGLSGRETINHNHAMLGHPDAWIGKYDTNPLRQDIEEIGKMIRIHMALNVVLNQDHQIADVYAGDPTSVMRLGIPKARTICGVPARTNFDLVIASAGGQPKDINFYQAQKALTHASLFARSGAPIILAAECPEGSGNYAFESIMKNFPSVDSIFAYFASHPFVVGPHKALQVARILQRNPIALVSSIPHNLVNEWLLTPADNLQSAVESALKTLSSNPSVAILPQATTTLPE